MKSIIDKVVFVFITAVFLLAGCKNEVEKEVEKLDYAPPEQIKNINATVGNRTVLLSWTNPSDEDFYGTKISFTPTSKFVSQPIIIEGEAGKNSSTIFNGLDNGVEYTFNLVALDKRQNEADRVTKTASPIDDGDYTAPKEVLDFKTMVGNSSIILSWQNPSDSDLYAVEISSTPAEGTLAQNVILIGNPSQKMTFAVSNLENAKEYNFTIKTIDKALNKSAGVQKTVSPVDDEDYAAPNEVLDFKTMVGNSSIILSWQNPGDSDFYAVEISSTPAEGILAQNVILTGAPSQKMTFTVANLENSKNYNFTIKTIDKALNKSAGVQKTVSPVDDLVYTPPANVTNLEARNKGNSILLTWTDATDSDIFGYEVSYMKNDGSRAAFSAPIAENVVMVAQGTEQYLVRNLINEMEYIFTIKTIDTSGNKSEGAAITATPHESKLSIDISLPNDDGEKIVLTNDKAPVSVKFSSTDSIEKAVWKKGEKDVLVKPEKLLSDEGVNALTVDSDNYAIFFVTENGWYDVVAKDSAGRYECEQVEVKTVDVTPLGNVKRFKAESDGENINVTWKDIVSIGNYDSSLEFVKLTYVYNDDMEDADNGTVFIKAGLENASIPVVLGKTEGTFIRITAQTVDEVGNIGKDVSVVLWCSKSIVVTKDDVIEKISAMKEYGRVIVTGEYSYELMKNIETALRSKNSGIIDLDLSKISSMEFVPSVFSSCKCLKTIKIPDSVTSIDNGAFSGCTGLTSIEIPDSVTSIGDDAFYRCTGLTSIEIPDSMTSIGNRVFEECTGLTSIRISDSVTSIGRGAFYGCTGLTSIKIPDSVTSIWYASFSGCTGLTSIKIPDSVTIIGGEAFSGCTGLTSIKIPDSVTSIGNGAFSGCIGLTSIKIPDCVTSIDMRVFYECTGLISIEIPDNVTSIGNEAFSGCTGLTSIEIPDNVTKIYADAFLNSSLTSMKFMDNESKWYIHYSSAEPEKLLGAMSDTDTRANANIFRLGNSSVLYYYNEKETRY